VAKAYSKLLAYKDEYEIARLYSSPRFLKQIENEFEGDLRIAFNLAPPLISKIDPLTGRPAKREFGAWMLPLFHLLARIRRLRGTPFDIFGYSEERRLERRLIRDYEIQLEAILSSLTKANHHSAVELASLPEKIRGFGLVKQRNIDAVAERSRQLANEFLVV
jgi:indolepyruvate ferredoxin oxidoreductase